MSRVRKIKPKKYIDKPKPQVLIKQKENVSFQSEILSGHTIMNDISAFQKALIEAGVKTAKKGLVGNTLETGDIVDYRISNNLGFKMNASGFIDIVTTKYLTFEDKKTIDKIENAYRLQKVIETLEAEGYSIENYESGDYKSIIAKLEDEDEERIIEISTEHDESGKSEEGFSDNLITLHSVNFDNESNCKDAIDILDKVCPGKIIEEKDTGEYSKKSTIGKRSKRDEKKVVNKIASRSTRERKNKHRR
jgi:hypothetical protein